jgi:hypothetical protein
MMKINMVVKFRLAGYGAPTEWNTIINIIYIIGYLSRLPDSELGGDPNPVLCRIADLLAHLRLDREKDAHERLVVHCHLLFFWIENFVHKSEPRDKERTNILIYCIETDNKWERKKIDLPTLGLGVVRLLRADHAPHLLRRLP